LSQQNYWELVAQTRATAAASDPPDQNNNGNLDGYDITWKYPKLLGAGYYRKICLRKGLALSITDYQTHDDVIVINPDRKHSLELAYVLAGTLSCNSRTLAAGHHSFCGSGMAPNEVCKKPAQQRIVKVDFHLAPSLLGQWISGNPDYLPAEFSHLSKPSDQTYYTQDSTTTTAMHRAVQDILQCPFQGLTQRMYLEGKVWELMALQLAQTREMARPNQGPKPLKPEDVEQIHYAKEVLASRLHNPPSLMELARLVGINDCKLKAGFRQVFDTTVFGYVQDCRMEQSRQLLAAGEMSVAEAAQAVGYANRSHFAIAFRKKFGVNPSVYRRRQQYFG
ncbi:MAG: AraC family transcriptional regulator, partial [Cyanobacteria bacterium P01_D01_bin.2]